MYPDLLTPFRRCSKYLDLRPITSMSNHITFKEERALSKDPVAQTDRLAIVTKGIRSGILLFTRSWVNKRIADRRLVHQRKLSMSIKQSAWTAFKKMHFQTNQKAVDVSAFFRNPEIATDSPIQSMQMCWIFQKRWDRKAGIVSCPLKTVVMQCKCQHRFESGAVVVKPSRATT